MKIFAIVVCVWIGLGAIHHGIVKADECYTMLRDHPMLLETSRDQERYRQAIRREIRLGYVLAPIWLLAALLDTGAENGYSYRECNWPAPKAEESR